MGVVINGMVVYGGFYLYVVIFFVFSDYLKLVLWLLLIMGFNLMFIFIYDWW